MGRSMIAVTAGLLLALAVTGSAQQPAVPAGARPSPPGGPTFQRISSLPFPTQAQTLEVNEGRIRAVPVAAGLVNPFCVAFLPNGDMLVTEKGGRLRIVRDGTLDPQPIPGTPEVWAVGQGGLFDVSPHPNYSSNKVLYLAYAKPIGRNGEQGAATALARATFDGSKLSGLQDIFVAKNWGTGRPHFGGKIAWGRDGKLYLSTGERGERDKAQDPSLHHGVILRLNDDGTVPADNPFQGRAGYDPAMYSRGHRNVQGLAFDSAGQLWANEHGPQGGDELNRILPGKNYGWPLVTYGREYSGDAIARNPGTAEIDEPVVVWSPSIGMSGLAIYYGDKFPGWYANVFAGGLSGMQIQRVAFNDRGPVGREALLMALRLRIRDVREGPDGHLYVVAERERGASGGVLRIEPGPTGTTNP